MEKIKLNDILRFDDLKNTKIRFLKSNNENFKPLDFFKNGKIEECLAGQYWNYSAPKSYRVGQITFGFIKIKPSEDLWLLFHVGKVTKDLDIFNGVGYEYENIPEYDKYLGRLIIRYKNKYQNMLRRAESVIDDCEVVKILSHPFNNDIFPGYENINISWEELTQILKKENWKTALENQKGVYLITDISNGKNYVGSAYGENMILGRWQAYAKNGHGGNVELRDLDFEYIKKNFRYSILDIYKSKTDDQVILDREAWWKDVLKSREFGYNKN